MWNKPLKQVIGVAAGAVATLELAAEQATLIGVKFKLTGTTFNTSHIERVRVKVGPKVIWDVTGAQLLAYNAYKNGAVNTKYLFLDFTERDQAPFPAKELGGLDLWALLAVGLVTVDVTIAAGAVAPVMTAQGYFEPSQGNPVVMKLLPYTCTQAFAGKQTLPLSFRGAMLKRIFNFYTGTDWAAATDGNVSRMECKKNSLPFFDQYCTDARFDQTNFKKVPITRLFVCDFLIDNNHFAAISTMRPANNNQLVYDSFEINSYLTDAGGSNSIILVEALDDVNNL